MEKKVKYIIPIVVLLALIAGWFSSCRDDDHDNPPIPGAERVYVKFSLQVPAASNPAPATYAATDADENYIADIDILAFKPDADEPSEWLFSYRVQVSGSDIRDKDDLDTKEFNVPLVPGAGQQQLVVLANVRSLVDALSPVEGDERDQLLSQLIVSNNGRWEARLEADDSGPFTPFPMWGEATQTITSSTQYITGVSLMRSIARLDVSLADAVNNFELTKVYIYNSKNQCRVVPDRANLTSGGGSVTAATVPSGAGNNDPLEYTPAEDARALNQNIFLCEAAGPAPDQPAEATCLVLGGMYGGAMNYYRVDLFRKDENGAVTGFQDFLRNFCYRAVVRHVAGPGYPTPEEAFNAKAINITAEITDWDDGGLGFIIFDEQYAFSLSPAKFSFGHQGMTAEADSNRLQFLTDYPEGWTIENITDAETGDPVTWLDVMQDGQPSRSGPADTKGIRWIRMETNFGAERTAVIALKAGRMKYGLPVTQKGGATGIRPVSNSYIVAPGAETIGIPVDRAISHGGMDGDAAFTAVKLWDDNDVVASVDVSGAGASGYITVTVNDAGRQGNALVALKVNNDIYWSWHIWVTDFEADPPTATNSWDYNGYTFMDRNLGATANDFSTAARGLFYQWGRKDPFPATDIAGFSKAQGPVDQQTAHRNPDKIYYNGTIPYDWLSSPDNNLWGHEAAKSVYDPCPAGWRIPYRKNNVSPWNSLDNNNFPWYAVGTGRQYIDATATSRHPAAGLRVNSTGSLSSVGSHGYYWVASTSYTAAYAMLFSGFPGTSNSVVRAQGSSVRCVQYTTLTIDKTSLTLPSDAIDEDITDNRLTIYTDSKTGWTVESIKDATTGTDVSWLSLSSASGAEGTSICWGRVDENSGGPRSAVITIKSGSASALITVTQESAPPITVGVSNSYIVAPGSPIIRIPVDRAISEGGMAGNATFTVAKLWDDNNVVSAVGVEGSGATGYVTVTVNDANRQGNALVALRSGGNICWSWHIWVTDFEPDPPTASNSWNYNGYTFMDRNLGATANDFSVAARGLFYQWGRKDPFPATDIAGFSKVQGPVSQLTAHRNPNRFYIATTSSYSWLSSPNSNLWGRNSAKTVYDPCPEGWRVPSFKNNISPWNGLTKDNFTWQGTSSNTGRQYDGSRYPAAGGRYSSNGSVAEVGINGYYWITSSSYHLFFNNSSVNPSRNANEASGLSVRCVQYTTLTIDKTDLTLPSDALDEDISTNRLTIYTDHISGWTVENIKDATTGANADWLSLSSASGGYGTTTRWIRLDGNSGGLRSAIITIKSGSESIQVTVTQEGAPPVTVGVSNSYIVAPGSPAIRIPVERAINPGGMAAGAIFTAVKLWDDNNVVASVGTEGSGATGYITVTPAAANHGNALVALKVGNDIYWSWHIWVTDFEPDPATENNSWTYNGYTFMDRNLGATANDFSVAARGLFYQWGRKDPMPATDITGFSKSQGPVTQQTAHRNPDKFYTSGSNWLNTQVDLLWGHGAAKTVYDPCPEGWRVPSQMNNVSPWDGLTTGNFPWQGTGCQYSSAPATSRHPASGYRQDGNGSLIGVSGYGSYWSASPYGTKAYYLLFGGNVYLGSNNQAFGYSVRCVQTPMVSVDKESLILGSDAITAESAANSLGIYTDSPSGWTVESIKDATTGSSVSWLSLMPSASGTTGNITRWVRLDENTGSERSAVITVKAGNASARITVTQEKYAGAIQPKSNAYILAPGSGPVRIPVERANDALSGSIAANATLEAQILWSDATGVIAGVGIDGTGSGGYVKVTPGTVPGNAVVAVKVNNMIVWSWHIWVTAYQPAGEWMDRNLGALTNARPTANRKEGFGLYYQFGRKDPFPYDKTTASGLTVIAVSGNNIPNSVKNPASTISDWNVTLGNDTWGHNKAKTVYDPCPTGWRVPTLTQVYTTINLRQAFPNGSGPVWDFIGGYYPAAGLRDGQYMAADEGAKGYYWVTNYFSSGSTVNFLEFASNSVTLSRPGNYRSHCFPVRCVNVGTLNVSPNEFSLGYEAVTAESEVSRLSVYTGNDAGWTVQSITDDATGTAAVWLKVMKDAGQVSSGPKGLTTCWVSVTKNTTADRSATITIKSGDMTSEVKVTQTALYVNEPTPPSFTFGYEAQTGKSFAVTTNSTATAATLSYSLNGTTKVAKPDWITVNNPVRSTSGGVSTFTTTFSVTRNTSAARTCYIYITVDGVEKSVTVTQTGSPPPTDAVLVGRFAGELKEVSPGRWKYERLLYVEKTDASEGIAWGPNVATNITSDWDGKGNTYALRESTYPAANLCFGKNSGTISGVNDPNYIWYLPAFKQLMAIYVVNTAVSISATTYWSATENIANFAWCVYFAYGYTNDANKTNNNRVRCVRDY